MQSSTLRSGIDQTLLPSNTAGVSLDPGLSRALKDGQTDLVAVIKSHPSLLHNRSLLMDMVCQEYAARRGTLREVDLSEHCRQFEQFGQSIRKSIQRELEVLRFIDVNAEQPEWPKAGDTFDRFCIVDELGVGGSARVYLCKEDEVGDRPVVVKATALPSFEASILGKLTHDNIIPIYSTGYVEERDLNYLYMPYRGRSTLTDLVDVAFQNGCPQGDGAIAEAANRWTLDDPWLHDCGKSKRFAKFRYRSYVAAVLQIAWQIADALEYAHNQNIIHGDLKPSNVLLTPDGKPLLLDFNLSQDFSTGKSLRGGTLPYMPPEHLRAIIGSATDADLDEASADITADVYSFGALLYELLTGVPPHHKLPQAEDSATMAGLLFAAAQKGAPSVVEHNRFVSRQVESLVLQCLSFRPEDRPASMTLVKQRIQKELGLLPNTFRFARAKPIVFSLLLGGALVAVAAPTTYFVSRPPRYLSSYMEGKRLASSGSVDKAIAQFTSAIDYEPSFAPAKFERARAFIAQRALDPAINDLSQLVRTTNDPSYMEYLAYCFNLKRASVAAIPWYERAATKKSLTLEIANNLGASYIEATSTLGVKDRLDRANEYLNKALAVAPASTAVRLNLLRYAAERSQLGESASPFDSWHHARSLADDHPTNEFIETQIAAWYQAVLNHDARAQLPANAPGPSSEDVANRQRFAAIYHRICEKYRSKEITFGLGGNQVSSYADRYFLEPKSGS